MAAKTLVEAINRGFKAIEVDELQGREKTDRMALELRDFFAHQAQYFDGKQTCAYCEGKTIEFFRSIFETIRAFATSKPESKERVG